MGLAPTIISAVRVGKLFALAAPSVTLASIGAVWLVLGQGAGWVATSG
jgi:hypothetical protein